MLEWRTLSALCWRRGRSSNLASNMVRSRIPLLTEANNLNQPSSPAHSRAPLVVAASVSTLGGFLFWDDNIVISGAIGYLGQLFPLDAAGGGWAAGCAFVGCIGRCAAAGTGADYLGQKKSLSLCALCFALSPICLLFAPGLP